MPTYDEKPWWELEGKRPPWDGQFDAEAERLRQLRASRYSEKLRRREEKRRSGSVPPPGPPSKSN
jgi:hypothetical protein